VCVLLPEVAARANKIKEIVLWDNMTRKKKSEGIGYLSILQMFFAPAKFELGRTAAYADR